MFRKFLKMLGKLKNRKFQIGIIKWFKNIYKFKNRNNENVKKKEKKKENGKKWKRNNNKRKKNTKN